MTDSDSTPTKACKKCGECKPATAEFFNRHGPAPDGMSYRCKRCLKIYKDAYYQKNKERLLVKFAEYRAANPEKVRASIESWKVANPEKVRAGQLAFREKNKEKSSAWFSLYYQENKEKIRAAASAWVASNPDQASQSRKAWRLANPDARRISFQNRRARIRGNGGALSAGLKAKLMTLQRGLCACCNEPLGDAPHLDHIMPLALGGRNDDSNMQLLRAYCNMSKQDKHPIDFMQSKGFLL